MNLGKFSTVKIWTETKRILDLIRANTGQTFAELIDELARERLEKAKDSIKERLE